MLEATLKVGDWVRYIGIYYHKPKDLSHGVVQEITKSTCYPERTGYRVKFAENPYPLLCWREELRKCKQPN